jgi:hypothetical protein
MIADVVDRFFEIARKGMLAQRVRTGGTGAPLLTSLSAKRHRRLLRKFSSQLGTVAGNDRRNWRLTLTQIGPVADIRAERG